MFLGTGFYACSILITPEVLHCPAAMQSMSCYPNTQDLEFPSLQRYPPAPRDIFWKNFLKNLLGSLLEFKKEKKGQLRWVYRKELFRP